MVAGPKGNSFYDKTKLILEPAILDSFFLRLIKYLAYFYLRYKFECSNWSIFQETNCNIIIVLHIIDGKEKIGKYINFDKEEAWDSTHGIQLVIRLKEISRRIDEEFGKGNIWITM